MRGRSVFDCLTSIVAVVLQKKKTDNWILQLQPIILVLSHKLLAYGFGKRQFCI